jgi:hypothetical protein
MTTAKGRETREDRILALDEESLLDWHWHESEASMTAWLSTGRGASRFTDFMWRDAKRKWHERARSVAVNLKVTHAVLREPDAHYRVELQWLLEDSPMSTQPVLTEIRLIPDEVGSLSPEWANFDACLYLAALRLHLARTEPDWYSRLPRRRPKAGQPPDPDFYSRIVGTYNRLLAEGNPSPAKEIAERMGEKHSTVKGWLHRGRKYLTPREGI